MNSERVLRWATLVANLGAVVGLFLLVVGLKQNEAMMRAQTRNELSVTIVDLFSRVAENPQLASLRRRADAGAELTPDEFYQDEIFTRAFFRYWKNVHYQYRQHLYDEPEFSRQREAWRSYVQSSPAVITFWCAERSQFSPVFVSEFDRLLPPDAC
jgi:hypothetical protein